MKEYDILLNSKGYRLAHGSDGALQPNAVTEQVINPFARAVSADRQYQVIPFRFADGGGLAFYDGSNRYQEGRWIDSRGGHVIAAPDQIETSVGYGAETPATDNSVLVTHPIRSGDYDTALAQAFIPPTGCTSVKAVQVLVKRPLGDYSSAGNFRVSVYSDSSDEPDAEIQGVNVSLKVDADAFLPFQDRWLQHDWFWMECRFATAASVTPSTQYWIVIENNQAFELDLARASEYDGQGYHLVTTKYLGNWLTAADSDPYLISFHYGHEQDQVARAFAAFRGSDNVERVYMACGHKVMYYSEDAGTATAGTFVNSKELTDTILGLIEFKSSLWAYQGPNNDIWVTDGASATGTWTQKSGIQANAMAIHDNLLWRVDVATIYGTQDGSTWAATAGIVGDEDIPVFALVSHGGKLFAAKPDGIYEITYPDTYPTTGKPVANKMIDFSTEKGPRPWLLDWHSGLYFPGIGGFYEFKNNLLRNAWAEKIDEGAQEIRPAGVLGGGYDPITNNGTLPFSKPRSWSPIYDARPGMFTAVHGTTRGIWVAYCDPHLYKTNIWFWDGRGWHDFGPPVGRVDSEGHLGEYTLALFYHDRGGGRGRLFVSSGINTMRWPNLPTWTLDRVVDADADYCWQPAPSSPHYGQVTPTVITPTYGAASAADELLFVKVGVTSRYLDTSDLKMLVSYKIDGESSWHALGGYLTVSPYQEVSFSAQTTGRQIQFKVEFLNNSDPLDDTVTQVLEQLDLMFQPMPEAFSTFQLIIDAAGNAPLRTGGEDTRTTSQLITELRALADSGGFAYVDPVGVSHTVRVTGVRVQYVSQHLPPGDAIPKAYVIMSLLET